MARKRLDAEESRERLLEIAVTLLKDRGAAKVTVASVAEAAGCAKGLVHYHFKTKLNLWEAAAKHLSAARAAAWTEAFDARTVSAAVARTWTLLVKESGNGDVRAWFSLVGPGSPLPDPAVNDMVQRFDQAIGAASERLLDGLGTQLRVPMEEVTALLAAVIAGIGLRLLQGQPASSLENAYAAAWLGILSLGT